MLLNDGWIGVLSNHTNGFTNVVIGMYRDIGDSWEVKMAHDLNGYGTDSMKFFKVGKWEDPVGQMLKKYRSKTE